ncbi:MAG: endonuclease MutS2 [Bacteroidota bacterium]
MYDAVQQTSLQTNLRKLEFHKVLARISDFTVSETGRAAVLLIIPKADPRTITLELQKVSEAKELLITEGDIPLDGFKDIRASLKKLRIENSSLTAEELLEIAQTLRASRMLKIFLGKKERTQPNLFPYIKNLFADTVIEFNITQAIDEKGFIRDGASKELREIRQRLIYANDALRKKLDSILHQISGQEYLQEEIVTTRDGRLVIPVKTEYKNRVSGFIHSSSASGATVFIEPTESLELNNALRELQLSEQREIQRILSELTRQAAVIREPLNCTLQTLTELDVIVARAKYSIEIIGFAPALSETPILKFRDARHPILLQHLKREQIVPLTLELGEYAKTLVITGPNAGGKTVALKLAGLLCMCAQAGIHIPAAPDSIIFPFTAFFVDIGDDQSIDNDLSTFSSHLLELKKVLDDADGSSLVLLDEIGSGTDPTEGGALAAGILQELTRRGAITIATTHHGMLKAFAHEASNVVNGSMEFDQSTLTPTYKYRHGVPGGSYAFELAGRIGIDQKILNQSKEFIGDSKVRVESLLMNLEQKMQEYVSKFEETEKEKSKLEMLVKSYEQKNLQLKREVALIKKKAVEEAREIVSDAHAKIEKSIQDIREHQADAESIRLSKEALAGLKKNIAILTPKEESIERNETFTVGDKVKLKLGNGIGEIFSFSGEAANVISGTSKLRIPLKDLAKATEKSFHITSHTADQLHTIEAKNEIDLRGLLGDEALQETQIFLDNAYSAGLLRVDIIHGKGTGALRKRITSFLKSYPHIKSFRLGEWNEGGTGVTVVEFNNEG